MSKEQPYEKQQRIARASAIVRRCEMADSERRSQHESHDQQVCDQYQINPTQFYQWERVAERGARQALQGQPRGRKKLRPTEEALLAEVQRLREVIAEISSENLRLNANRQDIGAYVSADNHRHNIAYEPEITTATMCAMSWRLNTEVSHDLPEKTAFLASEVNDVLAGRTVTTYTMSWRYEHAET